MRKSSKKAFLILLGLMTLLTTITLIYTRSNEKIIVESLFGDKEEFNKINMIYLENSISPWDYIKKESFKSVKSIKKENNFLLTASSIEPLKQDLNYKNKWIYSTREKEKYNIIDKEIDDHTINGKEYLEYMNTESGEYKSIPIKNDSLLKKFIRRNDYRKYSLVNYKGDQYILAAFTNKNFENTKNAKNINLDLLVIKLDKVGNSYTELLDKTFRIKNIPEAEPIFYNFEYKEKPFLALKIKNKFDIFSYDPEKNAFTKYEDIASNELASSEDGVLFGEEKFVGYKNKLYYIYMKEGKQYIKELEFKNNKLQVLSTKATGFSDKGYKSQNMLNSYNAYNKKGEKIKDENSADFDYGFSNSIVEVKSYVKGNKVIFLSEEVTSILTRNINQIISYPNRKVSILDLDKKKEVYRGIIRKRSIYTLNQLKISNKVK